MGRVFVLDRVTGVPLIPVEERPAPPSDVPGETAWPTQPFSGISVAPEGLRADDAWGATEKDRAWCREQIAAARSEGIFTPPSLRGTVVFPGNAGGVNWGSSAYDPERHLLFMNTNRLPMIVRLIAHERLALEATRDAVDLFTGRTAWDVPLGEIVAGAFKQLLVRLFRPALRGSGSPNFGGPVATAGGLVFTAASMDNVLRAFDSDTGRELWKYDLPAGGAGHADDLPAGRTAVPRHRGRRPRQARHDAGRLPPGLHPALSPRGPAAPPPLPSLTPPPSPRTVSPVSSSGSSPERRDMDVDRPLPSPITPEAKPFWDGCRAEKLMLPRCEDCGHVFFYPRILCPRCHSRKVGWMQASGRGTLHSFEIAHQAFQKAWKIKPPYVLAMVQLEEGPRMMSNLINVEPSPKAVRCDMPVEVVFTKVSDDVTLPLFQPRR